MLIGWCAALGQAVSLPVPSAFVMILAPFLFSMSTALFVSLD
jgi:hypothetical protein